MIEEVYTTGLVLIGFCGSSDFAGVSIPGKEFFAAMVSGLRRFLNVTESDKCVDDGNGRVHDDRVIPAVLSSEFEDPIEGFVEHLVAMGNAVIR